MHIKNATKLAEHYLPAKTDQKNAVIAVYPKSRLTVQRWQN